MWRLGVSGAPNIADGLVYVSVDHHPVECPVKIHIGKYASKAKCGTRGWADSALRGDVVVVAGRSRPIEANHLVVKVRDSDSRRLAVVLDVSNIHPHPGACFAFGAEGHSGLERRVLEPSVALIVIELV